MNYGTHIDFPGHILLDKINSQKQIGSYPLDKFICESIVVDVRFKLKEIEPFIDQEGYINFIKLGNGEKSVQKLLSIIDNLEITCNDFFNLTKGQNLNNKAILFCSGLDKYWKNGQFEPWEFAYFFNPFISNDLAKFLIKEKVLLVGIDALQVESPIINFGGKEPLHLVSKKYQKIIDDKIAEVREHFIHKIFFENDIMIVENLKNLTKMVNKKNLFSCVPLKLNIDICTDNSITRAFAIILKDERMKI